MITEPAQAEHILRTGQANLILLARELLRDPYWPLHADDDLGGKRPSGQPSTSARPIATNRFMSPTCATDSQCSLR